MRSDVQQYNLGSVKTIRKTLGVVFKEPSLRL